MSEKTMWIRSGSLYQKITGDVCDGVKKGVYNVISDPDRGWFLEKICDEFYFPFKLYDLQNDFIDHIKKTYDNTTGNLGVLFNGIRGTGKSVSAKVFANMLNLPVIVVKSMGDANAAQFAYLSSLEFDCIFFFDEYEKQFEQHRDIREDPSVLQFMDGVYTSRYRRVFLLTTNSLNVNENLLDRPSRIRYIREFGNLQEKTVREYLDDNLENKEAIEDIVGFVDTLNISTIDILKTICEEVNIHGIDKFLEIKQFFNVSTALFSYETYQGTLGRDEIEQDGDITTEQYLREVNLYKNRYTSNDEFKAQMEAIKDEKKRKEFATKWYEDNHRRTSIEYERVTSEKKWNKLIPFKDYFNDDLVVEVDTKNRIIVTEDYYKSKVMYYINSEKNPSLYGNAYAL
jgi:SpoVK/Ycf46/Vps4 family AAA+-type ATPase